MPYADVPDFITKLTEHEGFAALAFRLLILTACRTNEVLGARWSEIDMDAGVWTIPGERMKAGREHRVPLSPAALDVLREAEKVKLNEFVFPGQKRGKPLSNMALLMLLRRFNVADVTAHGFRSSFRDWTSETTAHPSEVVEMALAHTIENKVEAAYRRGDLFAKRRLLMDDWATFCMTPPVEKVIKLEDRRPKQTRRAG
jgi:integrase